MIEGGTWVSGESKLYWIPPTVCLKQFPHNSRCAASNPYVSTPAVKLQATPPRKPFFFLNRKMTAHYQSHLIGAYNQPISCKFIYNVLECERKLEVGHLTLNIEVSYYC